MVSIKAKHSKGKTYYYLRTNVRDNEKIITKDKYIGQTLPKDIKNKLHETNIQSKWYHTLDSIQREYSKEKKQTPKSIIEKNLEIFATRFTYDTQKIEGSTLSLNDTINLLEWGRSPHNKPTSDIKEAEAHKKLFLSIISNKKEDLSLNTILEWHWNLFKDTKSDIAGKIRKYHVGIHRSKYKPPLPIEINPLLQEFFEWYKINKKNIGNKHRKMHPVELAGLVHLKFVTIHPFGDGNGRISRLMMNFVLNRYNLPMLNITYVNRNSYYSALERSNIKNDEDIFTQWFIKRYVKENKSYL
jgi:Fic family protein